MALTFAALHTFQSGIADSGDATLLQPSDWNAAHTGSVAGAVLDEIVFGASATSLTSDSGFKWEALTTAGKGLTLTAGTAASAVSAFALTQTHNFNTSAIHTATITVTETSTHATSTLFRVLGGSGGGTNAFSVMNATAAGPRIQTGTGSSTLTGIIAGYAASSGFSGIWPTGVTPSGTKGIVFDAADTNLYVNSTAQTFRPGGNPVVTLQAGGLYFDSTVRLLFGTTAPTLASGGCTTPGAITDSGTAVFSLASVGTSCSGSQPLVFTLPAATTGWNCTARNVSNGASSAPAQSGAVSTTSVTITNYSRTLGTAAAWTDGDVVVVNCMGY